MYAFLAVGSGAAIGAWLRWGLGALFNPVFPTLPLGTLAANLFGSLLMGLVLGFMSQIQALPPEVRLAVATGFLGALTTFSTFSAETVTLIGRGQWGWAMAAIGLHVAGALTMTGIGLAIAYAIKH